MNSNNNILSNRCCRINKRRHVHSISLLWSGLQPKLLPFSFPSCSKSYGPSIPVISTRIWIRFLNLSLWPRMLTTPPLHTRCILKRSFILENLILTILWAGFTMFLFSSRINRRKSFCFLSQNFTYLVLTRLAVNIPLAFTSANSSSRELRSFILPWHTKECCHLRKFIVTAYGRVTDWSLWTSIPNRAIFLSRKNPIGMLTWPHAHYMYPYQTTGTKRLLCSTACSISKVQISEVTEAGLKINKKVSAVASIPR